MMMHKWCALHKAGWVLVLVGALNWGLVGAFNFNLVMTLFDSWPWLERLVYILVGLSALGMLCIGKCCMKGGMCNCRAESCGHCGPEEMKKDAPPMGGEKKM